MKHTINNLNGLVVAGITVQSNRVEIRSKCGEKLNFGVSSNGLHEIEQTNTLLTKKEIDEIIAHRHEIERNATMDKFEDLKTKLTKLGMLK